MTEPSREVAAALLVGTCGRVLLQQRDDVPGILYPGQIGLFGGHIEPGETHLQCAMREIEEETGYRVPASALQPLVSMRMEYPKAGTVVGSYYLLRNVPTEQLIITEGSLCAAELPDLPGLLPRMTPSTCFVARVFLLQNVPS